MYNQIKQREGEDMSKEYELYNEVKNWDFSYINSEVESLTEWDLNDLILKHTNENSRILDLGTAGGEKVIKYYPEVKEIVGTDYSEEMIKTANENLVKSGRKNIIFKVMDNTKMTTPNEYFDLVVARHTVTDPKQIYKTLKPGGTLLIRGVDKMDCYALKRMFGKGQAMRDSKPISVIDYENVLNAGFSEVELVPIHVREYYKTKKDLLMLLYKAPIINDFSEIEENNNLASEEIDEAILDKYIAENTYEKGILLIRRYYGIMAKKLN